MRWLLLLLALPLPAQAQADASICDFYLQKSRELGCPDSNYLTRFGYTYCRTYAEQQDRFSPRGIAMLEKIRPCLIHALASAPNLTCKNARQIAEDSHVACYRDSGFCELSAGDTWLLVETAWREFFDRRFRRVITRIKANCYNR